MLNRKAVAIIITGTFLAFGCARKQQVVQPAKTQVAAPSTGAVQPSYGTTTKRYQAPYSK